MRFKKRGPFVLPVLPVLAALLVLSTTTPDVRAEERRAPGPVVVEVTSKEGGAISGATVSLGGRYASTDGSGAARFDGVPEGKYRLVAEVAEYDAFREEVTLPAGKREALAISLKPVVWSPISGRVLLEGSDEPLPGARISLTPKTVEAAVQGPTDFMTSWSGTFTVTALPPGVYEVRLAAAGCESKAFDLQVLPGMPEVSWSLTPLYDVASLSVVVRNDEGAAVGGATVTLAEGWPEGEIARGTTDGGGSTTFEGLKIGRLNRAGVDGKMLISRGAVTVQTEAEGHEAMTVPALLGRGELWKSSLTEPTAWKVSREIWTSPRPPGFAPAPRYNFSSKTPGRGAFSAFTCPSPLGFPWTPTGRETPSG